MTVTPSCYVEADGVDGAICMAPAAARRRRREAPFVTEPIVIVGEELKDYSEIIRPKRVRT